jgi:dihydroxyacetone kinase-like protein
MEYLSVEQMKKLLLRVCAGIVANEPLLTEADTVIGDGDHGTGMKRGFGSLEAMLKEREFTTLGELFRAAGLEIVKTMGGASGVIFGTLFIGGLDGLGDRREINAGELREFFRRGMEAIMKRGKAPLGGKTMLDAVSPAVRKMEEAGGDDIILTLRAGYEGALAGVEATRSMQSMVGRSRNFRNTRGHPDPGALSFSLIMKALSEGAESL